MISGTLISEGIKWALSNPEVGWVLVLFYLTLEFRSKYGKLYQIRGMVLSTITVIRALARVHDNIDTSEVDDYLLENGTEPDDFIDEEGEKEPDKLIQRDD